MTDCPHPTVKYIHLDGNSPLCSKIKTSNPKGMILCVTEWFNENKNNDIIWWKLYTKAALVNGDCMFNHHQPNTTKIKFCGENCAASLKYIPVFIRSMKVHLSGTSGSSSLSQLWIDIKLRTKQFWRGNEKHFPLSSTTLHAVLCLQTARHTA